ELVDDELHQQALAREDGAQTLNGLEQLRALVENLLALETGQPLQLHIEDRLRLILRQAELGHHAGPRFDNRLRAADQRNDRVEMIESNLQPLEDVIAGFGLLQLKFGAP